MYLKGVAEERQFLEGEEMVANGRDSISFDTVFQPLAEFWEPVVANFGRVLIMTAFVLKAVQPS